MAGVDDPVLPAVILWGVGGSLCGVWRLRSIGFADRARFSAGSRLGGVSLVAPLARPAPRAGRGAAVDRGAGIGLLGPPDHARRAGLCLHRLGRGIPCAPFGERAERGPFCGGGLHGGVLLLPLVGIFFVFGSYNLDQAAALPAAEASRWNIVGLTYYTRIMPSVLSWPTVVLACLYVQI